MTAIFQTPVTNVHVIKLTLSHSQQLLFRKSVDNALRYTVSLFGCPE